ncbi:MAG TPA: IS1634 family transposase [Candidatus Lokiarchaeia archaeon]|nr:IS1634 family transposase [Candidatus Lokiarchaeia archaeon]
MCEILFKASPDYYYMVFFSVKTDESGHQYVYVEERGWVNGKTKRTFQKYIGPRDQFGEVPTGRRQAVKPEDCIVKPFEFGVSAAMWAVAQELELPSVIDAVVGKNKGPHASTGEYLTIAAINRVADPCSKTQMSEWFEHDWLSTRLAVDPEVLNPQTYWNYFQRLSPADFEAVELELARRVQARYHLSWDQLLYDTTNFFTFAAPDAPGEGLRHNGHSKENRNNLPLVNVYLLCSKPWGIPLLHRTYPGNDQDAKTFKGVPQEVAGHLLKLGVDPAKVTLGFDKGNLSPVGMKEVDAKHLKFVGSLKNSTQKDLLHEPQAHFTKAVLPGSKKAVEYFQVQQEVYGRERTLYVVIDPAKACKQVQKFNADLARRRADLEKFIAGSLNVKKWRDPKAVATKVRGILGKKQPWNAVLTFQVSGEPGTLAVRVAVDTTAKVAHEETLGRSVLFTNQGEWAPKDVIWSYREQYIIEQAFRAMKDPAAIAIRPMYHWSEKSIEGHVFTCVLALFLLSVLRMKLAMKGIPTGYKELTRKLGRVHVSRVSIRPTHTTFFKIEPTKGSSAKYVQMLHLSDLI